MVNSPFASLTVTALANADTINNAEAKVVLNEFFHIVSSIIKAFGLYTQTMLLRIVIFYLFGRFLYFARILAKQVDSDNDD